MTLHPMKGVFVPVVTPFSADLKVDTPRFNQFCKWLVSQGAGLAVFGTNSEANSLSLKERLSLLDGLVESGINPKRMMPGTGCCSVPETVELTRRAVEHNCGGVLMLPPFFYKNLNDDGLFRYYSEVIQRIGSSALRVYLYHIPQFSGAPLSLALIERLIKEYGNTVLGIKDSSGVWSNTEAMLKHFPDFSIFPSSEAMLEKALPLGAAGCISATANIQPRKIAELIRDFGKPGGELRQKAITGVRTLIQEFPMIPALKHVISHYTSDPEWNRVRPPLTELEASLQKNLTQQLDGLGFEISGPIKEQ